MIGRRFALACLALVFGSGCAGAQFRLSPELQRGPRLQVDGELGFNTAQCDPNARAKGLEPYWGAREVSVGDLDGALTPEHADLTTTTMFRDTLLHDFDDFFRRAGISMTVLERTPVAGDLVGAIRFVLAFPASETETTGFGFVGRRAGRDVVATCRTTSTARIFGFFDGPRFRMDCRIVSSADAKPRTLSLRGVGTWTHYSFVGSLTGGAGESAAVESQDAVVAGMGAIRGFDLATGGRQVAALSYWQTLRPGTRDTYDPAAWESAAPASPGWSDARLVTLALAYAYAWPSSCDNHRLRADAMAGR